MRLRCRMDRAAAIALLPDTYAHALRLHDAGQADLIPDRLGIAPEAVQPLLRLAEAKLIALVTETAEAADARNRNRVGEPRRPAHPPSP